jgi:hypothetical protein
MPKEIAIYLNLLYSRADTGHFLRRTLATLFTDSAGDVITTDGNNRMIRLFKIIESFYYYFSIIKIIE